MAKKVKAPVDPFEDVKADPVDVRQETVEKAIAVSEVPHDVEKEVVKAAAKSYVTLTSRDRFLLKDTNNDGIPDTIVIEPFDEEVEAAKVEAAKWAPYHAHIENARALARSNNVGKSAVEIAAAVNVAEAEAIKEWKGAKPSPSKIDKEAEKAEAAAKAKKEALAAEFSRLKAL
jgi:hypothetical protein